MQTVLNKKRLAKVLLTEDVKFFDNQHG